MKNLTKFDIGVIIAFVVIGLLGGGAYWWAAGQLQASQDAVRDAKNQFDTFSTSKTPSGPPILVSSTNKNVLQSNIDLFKAQLDPLIESRLLSKDNKLAAIGKQDPIAWKHDLDQEVRALTSAAKLHGVKLPPDFYFAFSRYKRDNPDDDQTMILSKQLLAIEQIVSILSAAPVTGITAIRRTFEEDARPSGKQDYTYTDGTEPDHLNGNSFTAGGGIYQDYPYVVEFDTTPDCLRKVLDTLMQSPYVFVLRTLQVQNTTQPNSPVLSTLEQLAGTPTPSITDSDPGQVAAVTASTKGPQFLFGNSILHVRARIDLIEWNPAVSDSHHGK